MTVATEDSWRIYVVGMERCGRWRTGAGQAWDIPVMVMP